MHGGGGRLPAVSKRSVVEQYITLANARLVIVPGMFDRR